MMHQVITRVCGDTGDKGVGRGLGTGQGQAGLSLDETEREPSAIAVREVGCGWMDPGVLGTPLLKEVSGTFQPRGGIMFRK